MNADRAYSPLGPCEGYEFDLVEYVDAACSPERRATIRRHLESCGRCRAFVHGMSAVSESLARALPHVELSADFDAKLRDRIAGLARSAGRAAARVNAEQEYRGALASLRRGLTWNAALDALATAAVGGGLVTAAAAIAPRVLPALDLAHVSPATLSLGIGAAGLLAGLVAVLALGRQPWPYPTV